MCITVGFENEGEEVQVKENIVRTYKNQLSPLLIGTSDFTIGEEIGRGEQMISHRLLRISVVSE